MNNLLEDLHTIVFLKKLQSKTSEILLQVSINKKKGSFWKGYEQIDYEPLLKWISEYPDRGIPDLIKEKNEQLLIYQGMPEFRKRGKILFDSE